MKTKVIILKNAGFLNTDGGSTRLNYIYYNIDIQKEAIGKILRIETERLNLKK